MPCCNQHGPSVRSKVIASQNVNYILCMLKVISIIQNTLKSDYLCTSIFWTINLFMGCVRSWPARLAIYYQDEIHVRTEVVPWKRAWERGAVVDPRVLCLVAHPLTKWTTKTRPRPRRGRTKPSTSLKMLVHFRRLPRHRAYLPFCFLSQFYYCRYFEEQTKMVR